MDSSLRRTWAEIDLNNLAYNYEIIRTRVGPGAKLLGVIKADAYGHGAVQIARHLEKLGAAYLAVSNIDEAEELRAAGVSLPILMLGYTPADQAERILRLDMTQCVPDLEVARAYDAAGKRLGKRMKVHIKLDTGMGRLGFPCDEAHFSGSLRDILAVLALENLDAEGIFTHFSVSDEDAEEHVAFTKLQHDRFLRMADAAEAAAGFKFRLRHCCNAGGIASYSQWASDMVRCGIILYGAGELAQRLGMKPVMTLKTTVSTIRTFAPDTSVSYGRTYFTSGAERIAVLPIGYADGLHRILSNKLTVHTAYGDAPQVGRICMDMCMVDVSGLPELAPGDEVEIFGSHIPCGEVAQRAGTISYELLCAVSKRVPRLYFLDGKCVSRSLRLLG